MPRATRSTPSRASTLAPTRSPEAVASNRQSKKRKVDYLSLADQDIVAVIVEPLGEDRSARFNIHKHWLCSHGPKFREFLEDKDESKVMILRDVGVEQFETFSKWLYTKEVVVEEIKESEQEDENDSDDGASTDDSDGREEEADGEAGEGDDNESDSNEPSQTTANGVQQDQSPPAAETNGETNGETNPKDNSWYAGVNRKGRVFARLLDLYIFANKFKIVSLKGAVMLRFQRFIEATATLPCPTIVKHALDHLDFKSSMMCKYLTKCYGHYTDFKKVSKDRFATLSPAFLTAVLFIAFERVDGVESSRGAYDENWCDYHDHANEEERKECEKSRPQDIDVLNKRPRVRRWGGCC